MPFDGDTFKRLGLPPYAGPLSKELANLARGLTALKGNTIESAVDGTPGDGQVIKWDAGTGRLVWADDEVGSPGSGEANVQSDWNVTATASDAFIQNKPTIPDVVSRDNVYVQVKDILVDGANITTTDDDTAQTVSIAGQPGGGGNGSSTFIGLTDRPAALGSPGQLIGS